MTAADDDGPGLRVTLKDIYSLVLSVDRKVDPLPQMVADHEARLRKVERQIGFWRGAFIVLVFVASAIITYLTYNHP